MLSSVDFNNGRAFAKRMYVPRVIGTLLCGAIIALSSFQQMSLIELILLAINSLVWAHLACKRSLRSKNPFRTEKTNLLLDSAFCGFWIGIMHLKPICSATIFSMVAMNNMAVGGPRLLFRGFVFKLVGLVVAFLFVGVHYVKGTEYDVWICLPLILIYPVAVALSSYQLASELKKNKKLLRELSSIDSLTGLLNRRSWSDVVSTYLSRREVNDSILVIIDVDHFKSVNDQYGHAAGDEILCVLSGVLRSKLRSVDPVCRYGGDEFCALLVGMSIREAQARMHEVCEVFVATSHSLFPESSVTLSVGMMPWNNDIADISAWFSFADKNLYKAKRKGRNQIVCDVSPSA